MKIAVDEWLKLVQGVAKFTLWACLLMLFCIIQICIFYRFQ